MSRYNHTRCAACDHERHLHPLEPTITPKVLAVVNGACLECGCKAWQEPRSGIIEKGANDGTA